MYATTKARVKALLDIPDATTTHDAVLTNFIAAVSKRIEAFIDRPLLQSARTEEYDLKPRQRVIFLRAYPLTAQSDISSIKVATDWDFAAATAVSSSDYHVDLVTGAVHLNYSPITNYLGNNMGVAPGAVQVVYTGGLGAVSSGSDPNATFLTNYADIASACETQVVAMWRRRDDPGRKTTKIGQYGATNEAPLEFLSDVRQSLLPYRRQRFGQ